jgi:hypothetical protein
LDERLRQNVLAGVLLYVVQPARPINSSSNDRIARRRETLHDVKHATFTIIDALGHARAVERARVAGLSAAGRIKSRAIEHDRAPATDTFRRVDYASFKLDQMRVVIIEAFSRWHGLWRVNKPTCLVVASDA